MRKKKKSLFFIIALLVMCFGIGYAYLTTTLSINGVTDVDANNWDVYFDNVNVTEGSVSGEQVIEAPTITSDTEVEFHIRLKEPGDFYAFTIDAKNDGTIDAMINTFSKKINGLATIPDYLNYIIVYSDGTPIENNHLLAKESLETYYVFIEYRRDIDPDDLPSTAQSLTLSFDVEYVQADSNAKEIMQTLYSHSTFSIGTTIMYTDNVYDNNSMFSGNYVHFKYEGRGYKVNSAYIGFEVNGTKHYVRGAGATFNDTTGELEEKSPYYENNKIELQSLFGESNCMEQTVQSVKEYQCNSGGLFGSANEKGLVKITDTYEANYYIYENGEVRYFPQL